MGHFWPLFSESKYQLRCGVRTSAVVTASTPMHACAWCCGACACGIVPHTQASCAQKLAVERARSGEIGMRPSERRRIAEAQGGMAPGGGGGYPDNFGGGGRGGGRGGGYDYGGGGGRGGYGCALTRLHGGLALHKGHATALLALRAADSWAGCRAAVCWAAVWAARPLQGYAGVTWPF